MVCGGVIDGVGWCKDGVEWCKDGVEWSGVIRNRLYIKEPIIYIYIYIYMNFFV